MDKSAVMGEAVSQRALIEAIIRDYHTTRLNADFVPHILAQDRTQAAFARFKRELALWVTVHCPTCGQRFVPPYYPKEEPDLSTNKDETIARIQKVRDGYASQAKFADIDCAVHFREFVRRIDAALTPTKKEG